MPGLASLLSRRTMNPRAGGAARRRALQAIPRPIPQRRWKIPTSDFQPRRTPPPLLGPPGGEYGGQVKGYQLGGIMPLKNRERGRRRVLGSLSQPVTRAQRPLPGSGGWQEGGPVGVSPEEVEMAAEIYAMATPEQQAQITGGGGPGMMDEEAAIGEALAMAMGGGGGGPPMGGPPMGGPPMNGAPPMGGMI